MGRPVAFRHQSHRSLFNCLRRADFKYSATLGALAAIYFYDFGKHSRLFIVNVNETMDKCGEMRLEIVLRRRLAGFCLGRASWKLDAGPAPVESAHLHLAVSFELVLSDSQLASF
jgi:hypothetical protein